MRLMTLLFSALAAFPAYSHNVLEELPGCYQVDYSYSETISMKDGYVLDPRVYDATSKSGVYELFFPMKQAEKELHIQRVLFTRNAKGEVSGIMKHYAEILTKKSDMSYQYQGDGVYAPIPISKDTWVREVRYLDDGPSYSCTGKWGAMGIDEYFQCQSFAKIPGRESRDMKRKDYNSMERDTKLIFSSWGFLERQNNTKTIFENGIKTPLAQEVGKIFSIKVEDSLCTKAQAWASARKDFWLLSISVWNELLDGNRAHKVLTGDRNGPRFVKLWGLAEKYVGLDLSREDIKAQAVEELRKVISKYIK